MTDSRPSKWLPRPSAHSVALGAIFLAGLFVRFKGLTFGLPNTMCRPDEATIIDAAWNVFNGDPNPHFFYYPSLYIYLLAAIFFLRYAVLLITGIPNTVLLSEMTTDPSPFFVISRGVSALFGAATPIIVYMIMRRVWGRTTALIGAFFTSLCYLHVRDSHFGTTDVAATFLTLCAVFFTMEAFEKRRTGDYVRAGIFAGAAAATKYGSILVVLPMLFAHICACDQFRTFGSCLRAVVRAPRIWIYSGCVLLAFLVVMPFAVLDFPTFIAHFRGELTHLAHGHEVGGRPLLLGRGWWYHLRFTLPDGMGIPMLLFSLAGLVISLRKSTTRFMMVFLFPIAYYAVSGRGYTVFVRYMIPVLPFLCMAAAVFVTYLCGFLTDPRMRKPGLVILTAAILLPSAGNVIRFDRLLSRRDNRLVAAEWMREHLASGKTVYQTGLLYGQVRLPVSLLMFRHGGQNGTDRPDYVLLQDHPLPSSRTTDSMKTMLEKEYHLARVFHAVNTDAPENRYDLLDAFYIPYAGYRQIERPGPNLILFERN